MGQLFVYDGKKEICSASYEYSEESNRHREISIANYENIDIVDKYVTIIGIIGMKYKLNGKRTDIILSDENGSRKYINCIVSHIYRDGYELKYSRCERYE